MKGYIYVIRNKINDKVYIGITENINQRQNRHWNLLNNNTHQSPGLQNAFNLYGAENFYFDITEVEIENRDQLCQLEIDLIKQYNSYQNGYNGTPGGDNPPNLKKYNNEDMLKCLCMINYYPLIGKTLEEIFNYSKGTMSKLGLRQGYEEIWLLYEQLTKSQQIELAQKSYKEFNVEKIALARQMKQGGCSKAYQLTQEDYNLAFTLQSHKYSYTEVANILGIKPNTVKDWFGGRSRKKEKEIFLKLTEEEKNQIYCRYKIAELSGNAK